MTTTPYAKALMSIDGGALVSGAQTLAGGNVIQLQGESTVNWQDQIWQIYEYPPGYALPTGWTNNNGMYESSLVSPPPFTIDLKAVRWGKYLIRLVVNHGLLAGVYAGPGSSQPLVDISTAIKTRSPNLALDDIAYQETNQFDSVRQWIGELKATLRSIDAAGGGGGGGGGDLSDRKHIIFRPGIASGVGHVETWSEVEAAITDTAGEIVLFIDDSIASAEVPNTADTDCLGRVFLTSFTLTGESQLTIQDGGRLLNIGIINNLFITGAPTSVSPIKITSSNNLFLDNFAVIYNQAGASVAMVEADTNCNIFLDNNSALSNEGEPLIPAVHINAGFTAEIYVTRAGIGPSWLTPALIQGDATTILKFTYDASMSFVTQTLFFGTLYDRRSTRGNAIEPSAGNTAGRPPIPHLGQGYFDTTIQTLLCWNGTSWIGPDGNLSILWRPGGSPGTTKHVTTWAEVAAWVTATNAESPHALLTVYVDDSITACNVPNTANSDLFGLVWFANASGYGNASIAIADGGRIRNPRGADDVMFYAAAPTSVIPIYFDQHYRFETRGTLAGFQLVAGSVSMISGAHEITVRMAGATRFVNTSTNPLFLLEANQSFTLSEQGGVAIGSLVIDTPSIPDLLVGGGATESFEFNGEITPFTRQTSFTGTVTINRVIKPPVAVLTSDIDWGTGDVHYLTLSAGANVLTFSNMRDGQIITLEVTGAASTLTLPTTRWPGGVVPTQTPSGTDIYTFMKRGANINGTVLQDVS